MADKKHVFHYSMTALNTIIAVIALYLAFSHNKQVTDVDFLWESEVQESIPVEFKNQDSSDNLLNIPYSLSIWLNFKIVNTGFRTFTVDNISVYVSPLESKSPSAFVYSGDLREPQRNGKPTGEKITLPIIVEPGHSKYFIERIQIPISKDVYFAYKQKYENGKSEFLLFDTDDCSIFKKYDITSRVSLAGGQTKEVHNRLCNN